MSATTENTKETQRWREEFVAWLRMGNVPGDEIGDALKTVESHCAETGESPQEAFGKPRAYAASLGLGRPTNASSYLIAVPAFFGAILLVAGLTPVIRGGTVGYGWTDVVTWALMLTVAIGLITFVGRVRRPAVVSALVLAGAFGIVALLGFVGRDATPFVQANAWVVTIAGVVMMGYGVAASRPTKSSAVTDPVTGSDMLEAGLPLKWSPVIVPIVVVVAVVVLSPLI